MTPKNSTTPDYETFLTNSGGRPVGAAGTFAMQLEPGVPQQLPVDGPVNAKPASKSFVGGMIAYARRQGWEVVIRSFGNELWACRLKDDDAAARREHLAPRRK